jgi:hypothetical protein
MVPVCAKSVDERTDERMAIDRTEPQESTRENIGDSFSGGRRSTGDGAEPTGLSTSRHLSWSNPAWDDPPFR